MDNLLKKGVGKSSFFFEKFHGFFPFEKIGIKNLLVFMAKWEFVLKEI